MIHHRLKMHGMAMAAAIALMAMAGATPAVGEVIRYDRPYGFDDASGAGPSPGRAVLNQWTSLSFPKFDRGLGTLTGASFSLTAVLDAVASVTWTNEGARRTLGTLSLTSGYVILAPDVNSIGLGYRVQGRNVSMPAGGSFTLVLPTTEGNVFGPNAQSPTSLASYVGTGDVRVSYLRTTFSEPTVDQMSAALSHAGVTHGEVSLIYTYTATPEPSALVLVAVGGLGLLTRVWRRRG